MNPTEKLAKEIINNDKKFQKLLKKHYPLQYIIGNTNFYGFNIKVNKNVLVPRFETEELVEKTINLVKKLKLKDIDILELGTGSGCISIALSKELNPKDIDALDRALWNENIRKDWMIEIVKNLRPHFENLKGTSIWE